MIQLSSAAAVTVIALPDPPISLPIDSVASFRRAVPRLSSSSITVRSSVNREAAVCSTRRAWLPQFPGVALDFDAYRVLRGDRVQSDRRDDNINDAEHLEPRVWANQVSGPAQCVRYVVMAPGSVSGQNRSSPRPLYLVRGAPAHRQLVD